MLTRRIRRAAKYYAWTTITTRTIVIKATTRAKSFLVRMSQQWRFRNHKKVTRNQVPKSWNPPSLTCCQNFATPKSSMSTTSWAKARSHLILVQNIVETKKESWKVQKSFFQDCQLLKDHLHHPRQPRFLKSPKSGSSWRVARWPAWKICCLLKNSTPMPSNYSWLHCPSRPAILT